jgi:acyl-CoA dehydrogenase
MNSEILRPALTEELEMFRDSYRHFLSVEAVPYIDEWRAAGIVDRELYRKAGENGFLLPWVPERYGGIGLDDFRYDQVMVEENNRALVPEFFINLHNRIIGPYLGNFANEEQKARFLPGCVSGEIILAVAMTEPGAGSDLAGIRATAVEQEDCWLLNGSKTYISSGINADLVIVAAKSNPENPRSIGLFLVERGMGGFERGRNLEKMGLKAQDTAELFFNNVRVPKDNVLGDPLKGFHYLMQNLSEERLSCAVDSVSACETAIDLTKEFIADRKAFGQSVAAFQNSRFRIAEMVTEVSAAYAFVDRCVELHNARRLTPELAAQVKLFASEVQGRVVDECVQLHGGAGYMDEYPISRFYTNARVTRIFAGSSEIMKEIIARSELGR